MITWYRQPSANSCGQTCIAMLTGITPEKVIESIPDNKGTIAAQLIDYLRSLGWETDDRCKPWRPNSFTKYYDNESMALCRVRWGDSKSRRAHWVLLAEQRFWDPLARDPIFIRQGGRVLSSVAVEKP